MTIEELKTKLHEIAWRDGNYLDKRADANELLLDYVLGQVDNTDEKRKVRELYLDAVE